MAGKIYKEEKVLKFNVCRGKKEKEQKKTKTNKQKKKNKKKKTNKKTK